MGVRVSDVTGGTFRGMWLHCERCRGKLPNEVRSDVLPEEDEPLPGTEVRHQLAHSPSIQGRRMAVGGREERQHVHVIFRPGICHDVDVHGSLYHSYYATR